MNITEALKNLYEEMGGTEAFPTDDIATGVDLLKTVAGGAIKTETSTEFKAYLDSLEWQKGGTYTEAYEGNTYTLTVADDAYAMKNCPWAKLPNLNTQEEALHVVAGDGVTPVKFSFDLTFGLNTDNAVPKVFTIKEDCVWFISMARYTGMYAIVIAKASIPYIMAMNISTQGELKRIIRLDGNSFNIIPGCTVSSADATGIVFTNPRQVNTKFTLDDLDKLKELLNGGGTAITVIPFNYDSSTNTGGFVKEQTQGSVVYYTYDEIEAMYNSVDGQLYSYPPNGDGAVLTRIGYNGVDSYFLGYTDLSHPYVGENMAYMWSGTIELKKTTGYTAEFHSWTWSVTNDD